MAISTYQQSFDEILKSAYSHGLEAIYSLEYVDPKSIKRISHPVAKSHSKTSNLQKNPLNLNLDQYELDLGPQHRNWIEPFLLREPIQVLELSKQAEKCLLDHNKKTLRDLVSCDLKDFVFFKGMGQGHIDETKRKLQLYISDKPLHFTRSVDYASWLSSILGTFDRKKTYILLQEHQLSHMLTLTPSETVEVKRMTLEVKQEYAEDIASKLGSKPIRNLAISDMNIITDVLIKPWMRGRLGLATRFELLERIQRTSTDSNKVHTILNFLSAMFFDHAFPLATGLCCVEENLYCVDAAAAYDYSLVVDTAYSYFYKDSVQYPLYQLIAMIERELAKNWLGLPAHFTEKVLRNTPRFCVRKNSEGILSIRLA